MKAFFLSFIFVYLRLLAFICRGGLDAWSRGRRRQRAPRWGAPIYPLRWGLCSANVPTMGEPGRGADMVARVSTVAFEGVEARPVDVQVQIASGTVAFTIVGLGDKAVGESRERVRSALIASGLALPAKRITVNLAPADMPKEGSHYDLPIALAVMAAIGAIPPDALDGFAVIGELALDGAISAVAGVLPAAIAANAAGKGLICPAACGPEAAWASADLEILAPRSLIQLANHFKGAQVLSRPEPALRASGGPQPDLRDIKGQESAKRALEVAAAGGHNLLMSGAPGAGKSMLAERLPSILPPLTPRELLEVSMIHSVAGALAGGALTDRRPPRCRLWSGAARMPGPARFRSPTMVSCSSTNCRSFSPRFWIACANRSRPAKWRSRAPTIASSIRRGFN